MNSVLEQYLRAYVNYLQNDWASWLPSAEFAINNHAFNDVLREQMVFAQASYEQYANVHRQNVPNYALSDEVWLDTRNMQTKRPSKKLSDKFDGLFPITKIVSPHAYKFELLYDWTRHMGNDENSEF